MRSAASRDTDVTKQNNLYTKLQHSSAASLFRTSLEIGQNLHSTAKLRMMFAQLHQFKKLNSILYIIRNTLLKICMLLAPPEVCYATPRGVATPSLGSSALHYGGPPVLANSFAKSWMRHWYGAIVIALLEFPEKMI